MKQQAAGFSRAYTEDLIAVLKMADIVFSMLEQGLPTEEICLRLQMEPEEVYRLANQKGIPKSDIVAKGDWSNAWTPE